MKKLLILDIDETLIHSYYEKDYQNEHFDFHFDNYYVKKRPNLDLFLNEVLIHYKVAFWTSATQDYASNILKEIIKEDKIEFIYSREKCTLKFNYDGTTEYIKNLNKIKNKYNLNDVLIVDDLPKTARKNYGNYIKIEPFNGELNDNELIKLLDYLIKIKDVNNFRELEKRNWNVKEKIFKF